MDCLIEIVGLPVFVCFHLVVTIQFVSIDQAILLLLLLPRYYDAVFSYLTKLLSRCFLSVNEIILTPLLLSCYYYSVFCVLTKLFLPLLLSASCL